MSSWYVHQCRANENLAALLADCFLVSFSFRFFETKTPRSFLRLPNIRLVMIRFKSNWAPQLRIAEI